MNYDIDEVKQAVISANKYWFDYLKADYARVDAAKCMRPSDIHDLQTALGVPTFGENFDMDVNFISQWVGENGETGMLDFPLFQAMVDAFAHDRSFTDTVKMVLDQDYKYGHSANEMVTFIDNHDRNRFLTEAADDKKKLHNALAFLFAVRGNPVVFQGTEQNRGNANGRLMNGMPDIWNRWSMVSRDEYGNVLKDYFDTSTDTYSFITKLNGYRASYSALSYGRQTELWSENDLYAFSRCLDNDKNSEIICVFNKSANNRNVYIPLSNESKLEAGAVLENIDDSSELISVSRDKKICLNIPANSYKFFKINAEQTLTTVPVTLYLTDVNENVYLSGNTKELGQWDTSQALVTTRYNDNIQKITFNCPIYETIELKFFRKLKNGAIEWEHNSNHILRSKTRDVAYKICWSKSQIAELQKVCLVIKGALTNWGENIYVSGNVGELGTWNAGNVVGPALCPNYPDWELSLDLPILCDIEWKALKIGIHTNIWQTGDNHHLYIDAVRDEVLNIKCSW